MDVAAQLRDVTVVHVRLVVVGCIMDIVGILGVVVKVVVQCVLAEVVTLVPARKLIIVLS